MRDKFLTEAMKENWYGRSLQQTETTNGRPVKREACNKCKTPYSCMCDNNFSTPDGFFKLWNWAKEQEWWCLFLDEENCGEHCLSAHGDELFQIYGEYINPNLFADALYKFLSERSE